MQLNWTKDLKEGRFLLRQVNDPTKVMFIHGFDVFNVIHIQNLEKLN